MELPPDPADHELGSPAAPAAEPAAPAPPPRPPAQGEIIQPYGFGSAPREVPTFQTPPPRHQLARRLGLIAAVAVVLVGLFLATGGHLTRPRRRTTSSTTTSTTAQAASVSDRDGAVISAAALDEFEAGCRRLDVPNAAVLCRCARGRVGGKVAAKELDDATEYFAGRAATLPAPVRSVLDSCTAG